MFRNEAGQPFAQKARLASRNPVQANFRIAEQPELMCLGHCHIWLTDRVHVGVVYITNPMRCRRCSKRSSPRRVSKSGSLFKSSENALRSEHAFSNQQNACSLSPMRTQAHAYSTAR